MTKQVANVQLMQKMNRLKVLNYVRKHPDCSRPEIARETGLSLASITNVTSYLLDIGILSENGTEIVGRVGRKRTLLRFSKDAYSLICVFLSEDYINIYVTDLLGNPTEKIRHTTENLSSEEVVELIKDALLKIITQTNKNQILGIGVSISGLVLENSRFIFSSKFKWKSFDIKSILEDATDIPVFVYNISPVRATWHFNKESKKDNMLFLDLENGIGAVWYSEGRIISSVLGEIGHTTVEKDGEPCFCGSRGCLEAMCNEKRLLTLYESSSGQRLSGLSELEALYKEEDKSAIYTVNACARYLGIGIANLVNIFNPSTIIINTGDFRDLPSLISGAEKVCMGRAFGALTSGLEIKRVTSDDDTTVCGMAYNLCDKLFDINCPDNIIE